MMRLLLLLLPTACNGGDDTGEPSQCGEISLTDAGNYGFSGTVDPPIVQTASGVDLDICWTWLTEDIQCHPMDPADDVDLVSLVRFPHLSEAEVADKLSRNSLQQADISGYVFVENDGQTCTTLSAMSFFGTPVDVASEYTSDGGTYLLMMATGTIPGVGARMLTFLDPVTTSENTTVDIEGGCDVLQFEADLQTQTPTPICAEGPWTVEWSAVSADAQGNPVELDTIDVVTLGFYAGMSAADLEAGFLDLETLATTTWTADLDGEQAVDLSTLTVDGSAFDGFSGDGTWVFALRCSRCSNPAPVYLTVLEPK